MKHRRDAVIYRRYENNCERNKKAEECELKHSSNQNLCQGADNGERIKKDFSADIDNKTRADEGNKNNEIKKSSKVDKSLGWLFKFIPQSLYNPETGKVFGFMSAEDLLIGALILLIIDSGENDGDNTMLILVLLYLLLSDYIELPF